MLKRMFSPLTCGTTRHRKRPLIPASSYLNPSKISKDIPSSAYLSNDPTLSSRTRENTIQLSKSSKHLQTLSKQSHIPSNIIITPDIISSHQPNISVVSPISTPLDNQIPSSSSSLPMSSCTPPSSTTPKVIPRSLSSNRILKPKTPRCTLSPNASSKSIDKLEKWIGYIKQHGFENNSKLLATRKGKAMKLGETVKHYHTKVNQMKKNDSKAFIDVSKAVNENYIEKDKFTNVMKNKNAYVNEIKELKGDVEDIPMKIQNYKMETIVINEQCGNELREIIIMKEEIGKMNKLISDINKQKELMLNAINVVNKNVISLKGKIIDVDKSANHFMENVKALVKSKELFDNN